MRILVAGGAGFKGRALLEAEKLSFENGKKMQIGWLKNQEDC